MKYRTLGKTDLRVPILSFGASSLGTPSKEIDKATSIRTVHEALDLGMNLLDVSPYYGLTGAERVLGVALKDSNVPRDGYTLATKAGRYDKTDFDFSPSRIVQSLEASLQRLNTDYIDIFQLHDIEFASLEEIVSQSIPVLQRLKQEGKIRFYGVTGLPLKIFKKVLADTDLDVILPYCHYSLNDTTLMEIRSVLEQKQVGLINASPLSMGLLSSRGPMPWHPASLIIKEKCQQAALFCREQGADLAKLAVQYSLDAHWIPTTLVGTANPENLRNNVKWLEEPIDRELLQQVLDILEPIRNYTWLSGRTENNEMERVL